MPSLSLHYKAVNVDSLGVIQGALKSTWNTVTIVRE